MSGKEKLILIEDDFYGAVEYAANLYNRSGVFVYPTDTIYGIGADPLDKESMEKINEIKGRGEEQKFILLAGNLLIILEYTVLDEIKFKVLNRIWPGPVSVILPLKTEFQKDLNSNSIAFRIPDNKFCLELLSKIKKPLISTSVNKTGAKPLNDPKEILSQFGEDVDAVFYTNQNKNSPASTLIDLTGNTPVLLREGGVKYADILAAFGD